MRDKSGPRPAMISPAPRDMRPQSDVQALPDLADTTEAYLESLQLLERLHRLMLDLVKDEFERLGRHDLTPVQAMILYNLGQIHQDLGETKDAAAYYRRCLKRDPEYVYAALRLGQLAEGAGRFTRARRWYAKALELPGGKGPAQRRLARLALRLDNHDEAREHLHQALLADPQDAMALNLLARLCRPLHCSLPRQLVLDELRLDLLLLQSGAVLRRHVVVLLKRITGFRG